MSTDYSRLFNLKPGYIALNHGSFGACPVAVQEYQFSLMRQMESLTTKFMMVELKPLMEESLARLADFIKAPSENIVFVRNASTAASAVLNSIPLQPGDEIVTTNLIYESCSHLLQHIAKTKSIAVRTAIIPFPVKNDDTVLNEIFAKVNAGTKLIFVDHVASTTGTIMPVSRIVAQAKQMGIETFIDGAHAPGMIPVNITKLSPDYYTGNCHKWMCSPKGAAFLYVDTQKQHLIKPPVISNYFFKGESHSQRFFNSFYWQGTMDYTSCLSVKKVIDYISSKVPGGWDEVMERNRQLVLTGRDIIIDKLGWLEHTNESMTGAMVSFKTGTESHISPGTSMDYLYHKLLDNHKIEANFPPCPSPHEAPTTTRRLLRISAHLYNKESDYEKLADALTNYF